MRKPLERVICRIGDSCLVKYTEHGHMPNEDLFGKEVCNIEIDEEFVIFAESLRKSYDGLEPEERESEIPERSLRAQTAIREEVVITPIYEPLLLTPDMLVLN